MLYEVITLDRLGHAQALVEVGHQRDLRTDRLFHRTQRLDVVLRRGTAQPQLDRRKAFADERLRFLQQRLQRLDAETLRVVGSYNFV